MCRKLGGMMKILFLIFMGIEAIIDLRKKEIYMFPVVIAGVIGIFVNVFVLKTDIKALLMGFLIGIIVAVISIISKGGIGMGDALILGVCGIYYGFDETFRIYFIALVMAALIGLILLIKNPQNRKRQIPFIPFIFLGMAGVLIWQ